MNLIDLSDNTNAWGTPPAAAAAMAGMRSAARYPSAFGDDLKSALADHLGISRDMIVTGCGSDNVLDSAIRAHGRPGDALAYVAPTFGMIPILARLSGMTAIPVAFDELLDAGRIIYVCSPNNPTGEVTPRARIAALLAACSDDQFIIVDEAYAEFSGVTALDLVGGCERVLVVRTMSKAWGLAGLRVGYGVASPPVIRAVERARGPYTLNAVAERAGAAAIRNDVRWVERHAALACEMRDRLVLALLARGLEPLPSQSNFVFVPMGAPLLVARRMRERGVSVRAFESPPGLRITVAPWPLLEQALLALDQARAE